MQKILQKIAHNMQEILQKIAHNVQKIADNMQYRYVHTSILAYCMIYIIMLLCMGNCVNSRAVTLYGYFCHLTTLDELLLCMCNVDILRAVTLYG